MQKHNMCLLDFVFYLRLAFVFVIMRAYKMHLRTQCVHI